MKTKRRLRLLNQLQSGNDQVIYQVVENIEKLENKIKELEKENAELKWMREGLEK